MNSPLKPATPASEGGLSLQVLNSLDQMHALTPEWKELLAQYSGLNLFLTPVWNRAWWCAFGEGKALRLLAMRSEKRLVGLAIYMLHSSRLRGLPVRIMSTFSNPHVSRTDVLAAPGFEAAVARQLAAYFARSAGDWDMALLQQLPADAPWIAPFVAAAAEYGLWSAAPVAGLGKCVLSLHGTWKEFLAAKSRHFRTRLRENMRRVEKHGTVLYRRSSGSAEDFEIFANLEEMSWKGEDDHARLGAAGWAFQRELAMASTSGITCHNLFLELDGRVVGGVHSLAHDGTVYSMQTLFDESQRHFYPGRAQFTMHVADMFDEARYEKLDLNGNSPFCKSWSDAEQRFISLQLFNRRPYSSLLCGLKRLRGLR